MSQIRVLSPLGPHRLILEDSEPLKPFVNCFCFGDNLFKLTLALLKIKNL